jgi:peptidoglycan/LPS O-acetylase OafA/YrhL
MGIAQVFANKTVVFLGTISFGIYMVHYPMLEIVRYAFDNYYSGMNPELNQPILWAHLCGILFSVVAMASLCYFWIEKPSRKYLKRKLCIGKNRSHELILQNVNV